MCRFIETICVLEGRPQALSYHCARVGRTLAAYDDTPTAWCASAAEELLAEAVELTLSQGTPETGRDADRQKLRLVYRIAPASHHTKLALEQVQLTSYSVPHIRSLRLVEGGEISYAHKSHDRSAIARLYAQRGFCDEILITRHGRVTDSSFCNIALFDRGGWSTPAAPLLAGTRREQLLENAEISVADIHATELRRYTHIALFNAMIDLGELVLPLSAIYR